MLRIRQSLSSNNAQELAAAIYAMDCFAARSIVFARSVLPQIASMIDCM
jgi:hypothetical protein